MLQLNLFVKFVKEKVRFTWKKQEIISSWQSQQNTRPSYSLTADRLDVIAERLFKIATSVLNLGWKIILSDTSPLIREI